MELKSLNKISRHWGEDMTETTTQAEPIVGSVGALWPARYDANNDRIKGFYDKIVYTGEEFLDVLKSIQPLKSFHPTRITLRMIVKDPNIVVGDEASIQLDGKWSGHELAYIGHNEPNRCQEETEPDMKQIRREEDRIKDIADLKPFIQKNKALERLLSNSMEFEWLMKPAASADIDNLVRLYSSTFDDYTLPLDHNTISQLVNNPNNLVGVVRNATKEIISIGIAERVYAKIEAKGEPLEFKFAELSDAATFPKYAGRGLYGAIAAKLMEQLAAENFDLAYGEARACIQGVNIVCKQSGREYAGRLKKHCQLSGKREVGEKGKYENLNVWVVTHDRLQQLYGDKNE